MLSRRSFFTAPAILTFAVGNTSLAAPPTLQQFLDASRRPPSGRYALTGTLTLHDGDVLEDLRLEWLGPLGDDMICVAGACSIRRCSLDARGAGVAVRVHPMATERGRSVSIEAVCIECDHTAFKIG